jgi:membrane protein implicated in regulation of membrane protease activity
MGRVPGLLLLKLVTVVGVLALASLLPPGWQAASLAALSFVGILVVLNNLRVLRRSRRDFKSEARPRSR